MAQLRGYTSDDVARWAVVCGVAEFLRRVAESLLRRCALTFLEVT